VNDLVFDKTSCHFRRTSTNKKFQKSLHNNNTTKNDVPLSECVLAAASLIDIEPDDDDDEFLNNGMTGQASHIIRIIAEVFVKESGSVEEKDGETKHYCSFQQVHSCRPSHASADEISRSSSARRRRQ